MSEWQTVHYQHGRQVKQAPVRKPKVPKGIDVKEFLEKELHNYGGGRFHSVGEACGNLLFNIGGGLPMEDLTGYEIMLLEDRYGPGWRREVYG